MNEKHEKMVDEAFEEAIKTTQKYLESCPVLILGCGTSIPHGIPSMNDLSEKLIADLDEQYKSNSTWLELADLLRDGVDLESALQKVTIDKNLNNDVIKSCWSYMYEKDIQCFYKLCSKETTLPLSSLLKKLLEAHPKDLSIITTNYDRLVEYAADFADAHVYCGFTGKHWGGFRGSEYNIFKRELRTIGIWKVHGSLDWFDLDNIPIYISSIRELAPNLFPLIVTPGISKYQETHKDPYRTVITQSDKVIRDASCYLCMGYGFNDEHIQPKLIQELQNQQKPIVIVTKELSQRGSEILKRSKKHVVFQEGERGTTRIMLDSQQMEVPGAYWQLQDFINIIY